MERMVLAINHLALALKTVAAYSEITDINQDE
jgi:hypothetical protein